jgi:hypothetical protein
MFNGTGGPGQGADASDFDKFKDLIGHLSMSKTFMEEKLKIGLGASYYYGGFRLDSANVKKTMNDSIVTESKAVDNFTSGIMSSRHEVLRKYMGVDAQVSFDWIAGITTVRGEYIQGDQPGFASSTKSPAAQPLDTKTSLPLDVYKRKFNGAYFYFLQNIMQTPLQLIFKYDWYDPNTDVKGDQIDTKKGFAKSNADLKYTTIGYGLAYRLDANTKITLYYDMVTNEKSANLSGYTKDLRDNVITARVQVKF